MPFVPLDENEKKQVKEPCRSREHFPPTNIYLTHPTKWVCASCGESFIINPTTVYCGKTGDSSIAIKTPSGPLIPLTCSKKPTSKALFDPMSMGRMAMRY